jgi:amino acid transporter
VSSVDVALYQVFFRDLFLATALHVDVSSFGYWHQLIIVSIIMFTQGLLNHYGIRVTTILTDISGYLIFVLTFIFIIVLVVYSPVPFSYFD